MGFITKAIHWKICRIEYMVGRHVEYKVYCSQSCVHVSTKSGWMR